jgi:hypothetical protein
MASRDAADNGPSTINVPAAIDQARAVLLVFSRYTGQSPPTRPLTTASDAGVPVVTFRLDGTELPDSLVRLTARGPALQASRPVHERHIQELVKILHRYFSVKPTRFDQAAQPQVPVSLLRQSPPEATSRGLTRTPHVYLTSAPEDRVMATAVTESLGRPSRLRVLGTLRNLPEGIPWAESVGQSIQRACAVVVLFSAHANASAPILRELIFATNAGVPIVCLRLDHAEPSGFAAQLLNGCQWIEAFGRSLDQVLQRLSTAIESLVTEQQDPASVDGRTGSDSSDTEELTSSSMSVAESTGSSELPSSAGAIDVFISAKSEDFEPANEVYEFLIRQGLTAFFSPRSLPKLGSADYFERIDEAIEAARHLVVVTSSGRNVRSRWVKHEWSTFLNEVRSDRKTGNVVTIVTGGLPLGELPLSLRRNEVLAHGPGCLDRLLGYVSRVAPD